MKKGVKGISMSTLQKFLAYSWPGNVRELENTIEYALAMSAKDVIDEDLIFQAKGMEEDRLKPLKDAKNEFEKNYLSNILSITGGNVSKASELSGKYRGDFYDLLKKHNLNPMEFKRKKQYV